MVEPSREQIVEALALRDERIAALEPDFDHLVRAASSTGVDADEWR
ncbi:hypothetical protein [Myceligenerans halotolerans]